MKKISFILPAYNEAEVITKFYKVLTPELKKLEYDYKLIFINDGSSDETLLNLKELSGQDKNITVINLSRNFGHQVAITAGIDFVDGADAAIIMDVDLQDPPQVIHRFIRKWEEGFEVVYGQRKKRKDNMFKRFSANWFYKILTKLANIDIPENTGDFRLIDKKVIDSIKKFREKNRFMRGLFSYVGFKQTSVIYDRDERYAGHTKYPLPKMLKLAADGIVGFSTFPLIIITYLGFLVFFISILGILYAIYMRVFYPEITVSGFTFTVISILLMGGIQMITLGILGNYIGRIFQEVKNRPLYLVDSVIDSGTKK